MRILPRIGLEPTRLAAPEPKSGMSTNFTIWAKENSLRGWSLFFNQLCQNTGLQNPPAQELYTSGGRHSMDLGVRIRRAIALARP